MSHSQRCIDVNRFGDGFDCICDEEPLPKALKRIRELEAELARKELVVDDRGREIVELTEWRDRFEVELRDARARADAAVAELNEALAKEQAWTERLKRAESEGAALRARIDAAITWLVTVKAEQPAGIIAERAALALKALRS